MSTSVFGVDHGEVISKASSTENGKSHVRTNAALGALSPAASGIHAGVKGKKGKKLRAIGNAGGGSLAGSVAGSLAASAVTRGNPIGSFVGGTAGAVGGAALGSRRNVKRGYVKGAK